MDLKNLSWFCLEAEFWNWSVFLFCLPWGRMGSSLLILMQQHRGAQRKRSVRKWVSHWKTRVLSNLWRENTDLYASLSFMLLWCLEVAGTYTCMGHPGHDGKNLFPGASIRFCILSPSAGLSVESGDICSDVLSDTEMPTPAILQKQLR